MEEVQSRGCTTASAAAAAAAALTLSLPVQTRAGGVGGGVGVAGAADSEKVVGGGGGGVGAASAAGGREDCWSEAATFTLIQAWGAHYVELNRGNLKQKHWKEVADAVNVREEGKAAKTDVQCKNRLDTLKKKYKLEKIKLAEAAGNAGNGSGNGHGSAIPTTMPGASSKWPFFRKLDELIGTSRKHKKQLPAGGGDKGVRSAGGSPAPHQQKQKHQQLQLPQQQQQQQLQQKGQPRGNEDETRMAGLLLPAAPPAQNNGPAGSGSTKSKESPDMTDSCPHALGEEGGGGAAGAVAGSRGNKNKKGKEDGNNGGGAAPGTGPGPGSGNGLGPGPSDRATEAKSFKKRKLQDGPYKDLARAIIKFGEVYERIESAKQRQLTELEKQRMEFTKDLELQRMQLFIQAQVELAKLKHAKHGGAGNENFL